MKSKPAFGQARQKKFPVDSSKIEQVLETKFDLFVQSRRVRQITTALSDFLKQLSATHPGWLEDNYDLFEHFFEELMDDSLLALDGVELDHESLELSVSLMSDIRRALSVVEEVVVDDEVSVEVN